MPEQNNLNQNQAKNPWLPSEVDDIKLHAGRVAQTETGWQKNKHQEIAEIRELAASPKMKSDEGVFELELRMRNLGMPGVNSAGRAFNILDKREEAMMEERALREQGQSYSTLGDPQKQEAEARIYNGNNFRESWQGLYDYAQINHQRFEDAPTSPESKTIKRGMETLVDNEIRLAAARDPRLGLNYKDNQAVTQLSAKIANDPEFIKFLNGEKSYFPNTTNIKFEIEKRIKAQNETSGNIQSGT